MNTFVSFSSVFSSHCCMWILHQSGFFYSRWAVLFANLRWPARTSSVKETAPFNFPHCTSSWYFWMNHAPCLSSFVSLCSFFYFLFYFTFCAQQLLWNLGTEYTKYDRTVGYLRPLQLPWPNQVTIFSWHCATLTPRATGGMWDERAQGALWAVFNTLFNSLSTFTL